MRKAIIGLIVVSAILVLFVVLVQGAIAAGGASYPSGPHYVIPYERSPSCQLIPVGISYWDGTLILGCKGPAIP